MKAITLHQPWAGWIADGYKTIETRTHRRFRGLVGQTIAIHAGLKFDKTAMGMARGHMPHMTHMMLYPESVVHGAIVCLAEVVDFGSLCGADSRAALIDCWSTKLYGLILGRVTRLEVPIPAKGHQGIWNWDAPDEIIEQSNA